MADTTVKSKVKKTTTESKAVKKAPAKVSVAKKATKTVSIIISLALQPGEKYGFDYQ